MSQDPRLLIPALGAVYRALAPLTEPLIRLVAGGSLAIHGYPILFGNIAASAKFLASVGFSHGVFWVYVVGLVEFVCGLCLALGFLTRLVAVPIIVFLSSPSSAITGSSALPGKTAATNIRCSGRSSSRISWCAAAAPCRSMR